MLLQTDRLYLREISIHDTGLIHELHSLPETDEFNTLGIPDAIQTTETIVNEWLSEQTVTPQTSYVFYIELLEKTQFIGLIALNIGKPKFRNAEVWYKIHVNYWRKGYTTEALQRILSWGFNELNLHRIEAGCAVDNIASSKVLEKAGMTQEGRKRKNLPLQPTWSDSFSYAILDEDFDNSQHKSPK
ncbi:MAG: GNAT family protein [Spirosomataceae bacterium]